MKGAGKEALFSVTDDYLKTTLIDGLKKNQPYSADTAGGALIGEVSSPEREKDQYKRSGDLGSDVLAYLEWHLSATYDQIVEALQVSPATVKRAIQRLKSENRLRRIGSKKTGWWEVM